MPGTLRAKQGDYKLKFRDGWITFYALKLGFFIFLGLIFISFIAQNSGLLYFSFGVWPVIWLIGVIIEAVIDIVGEIRKEKNRNE